MNYLGDSGEDAGSKASNGCADKCMTRPSFRMGGIAGHAGLFSTAGRSRELLPDDSRRRNLKGVRILKPDGGRRDDHAARCHTGWCGARTWLGHINKLLEQTKVTFSRSVRSAIQALPALRFGSIRQVIPSSSFFSNRVHPDGKGDVVPLRGRVASIVAGAITDTLPEKARVEAARAAAELLASVARLNATATRSGTASAAAITRRTSADRHRRAGKRRIQRARGLRLA